MEKGGCAAALAAAGLTATGGVGFADELRVGLRGFTRRVWGKRGVKVRQRLQLRYEWRYLFLAVDGRAGTVWWGWTATMTAGDLLPLVEWLRETGPDALVWDRAPSHRAAEVRGAGLPLIELPPSSPELNPAERLFEEIRRHVEGKVYTTLDEKVAEVAAFLEELDTDPARVRHLCGWDWIDAAFKTLPAPWEGRRDHAGSNKIARSVSAASARAEGAARPPDKVVPSPGAASLQTDSRVEPAGVGELSRSSVARG